MMPYQYLLKARTIQAASIVLSEPNADLKELVKRLGLANVAALVRKFRLKHGCSIEQYRASWQARRILSLKIQRAARSNRGQIGLLQ